MRLLIIFLGLALVTPWVNADGGAARVAISQGSGVTTTGISGPAGANRISVEQFRMSGSFSGNSDSWQGRWRLYGRFLSDDHAHLHFRVSAAQTSMWFKYRWLHSLNRNEAVSPYTWEGSQATIPNALWNELNTPTPLPLPGGGFDQNKLNQTLMNSNDANLGVHRQTLDLGTLWKKNSVFSPFFNFSMEARNGRMPRGFYHGTGFKLFTFGPLDPLPFGPDLSIVEIARPIKETSNKLKVGFFFGKKNPLKLTLSYLDFDNDRDLLTIASPYLGHPIQSLEAPGHHRIGLEFAWNTSLPKNGFLQFTGSWHSLQSEFELPPFFSGASSTPLPQDQVQLKVEDWWLFSRIGWTGKKSSLVISGKWQKRDPKSSSIVFPAYVHPVYSGPYFDVLFGGFPFGNARTATLQKREILDLKIEGTFRPNSKFRIRAGTSFRDYKRSPRAVTEAKRRNWWIGLRLKPHKKLEWKVRLNRESNSPGPRNADFYFQLVPFGPPTHPNFQPMDEKEFSSTQITSGLVFKPWHFLSVNAHYFQEQIDFSRQWLGIKKINRENWRLNFFFSTEALSANLGFSSAKHGRKGNWTKIPGDFDDFDPVTFFRIPEHYSFSDKTNSWTLGLTLTPSPGHQFRLDGNLSSSNGSNLDGLLLDSTLYDLEGRWTFPPTSNMGLRWGVFAGLIQRDINDPYLSGIPGTDPGNIPADLQGQLFLQNISGSHRGSYLGLSLSFTF